MNRLFAVGRFVVVLVAFSIVAAMTPSHARAADVPTVPSNNRVEFLGASVGGWKLGASIDAYVHYLSATTSDEGWFMVWRETQTDANHKTIVREGIYLEDVPHYRFDQVLWTATAKGKMTSIVTKERWERRDGKWYATDTWKFARAAVSLTWTSTELPSVKYDPDNPSTWISARASVMGWMSFSGLGVKIKLPKGVEGSMLQRV